MVGVDAVPASVEERRQIALSVADICRQRLQQDFGATEVIVYGSLRSDSPWHNASDLDLAVRGLSPETLLEAYCQLEALVPSWLPFDLVAIEQVDERLRDRILQLTPMPENPYLALKTRLQDELTSIQTTLDTLDTLLGQAERIPEIALIPAAAGYIEDFYSGCERLAQRVAITLDGGLPEGRDWHGQLLRQVANSGPQGRPPLWDKAVLLELDTYCRFRHRARHLYSINLDGTRVLALARQVSTVFETVRQAVAVFTLWLDQQVV